MTAKDAEGTARTPSTAFWHLPPNSARFSYATEGALFISAQLSTDLVSAPPPKGLSINKTVEATKCPSMHVNMRPGKKKKEKKSYLSIQTIVVLFELA